MNSAAIKKRHFSPQDMSIFIDHLGSEGNKAQVDTWTYYNLELHNNEAIPCDGLSREGKNSV